MKLSGHNCKNHHFSWFSVLIIAILIVGCFAGALARPQHFSRERRSGISDQRLAELETLMALARLRSHTKSVTRPIAFGLIDPNKIGRRRRRSYNLRNEDDLLFLLPQLNQNEKRENSLMDENSVESNQEEEFLSGYNDDETRPQPTRLGSREYLPNRFLKRFAMKQQPSRT